MYSEQTCEDYPNCYSECLVYSFWGLIQRNVGSGKDGWQLRQIPPGLLPKLVVRGPLWLIQRKVARGCAGRLSSAATSQATVSDVWRGLLLLIQKVRFWLNVCSNIESFSGPLWR